MREILAKRQRQHTLILLRLIKGNCSYVISPFADKDKENIWKFKDKENIWKFKVLYGLL